MNGKSVRVPGTPPNKSLDRSADSPFRNLIDLKRRLDVIAAPGQLRRWADQGHPEPSPGGEIGLQQSALAGSAAMATKDTTQRKPIAEASNQNQQRRIEKWLRRETF